MPDPDRAHLRSRWPARTRVLAAYALSASVVFGALDLVFARWRGSALPLEAMLRARAPWIVLPVAGWLIQRAAPRLRILGAITIALSLAWTWGNDRAFYALGTADTAVHFAWMVGCFVTVANYCPVLTRGRVGLLAAMMAGHVVLDLASPRARGVALRLGSDAVVFALVLVQAMVAENLARAQRRGNQLRRELERSVEAADESRRRAAESAQAVRRLAARVAHDVNNPLAAVKANVQWLGAQRTPAAPDERGEVVAETLAAIDRIARTVAQLKDEARAGAPLP